MEQPSPDNVVNKIGTNVLNERFAAAESTVCLRIPRMPLCPNPSNSNPQVHKSICLNVQKKVKYKKMHIKHATRCWNPCVCTLVRTWRPQRTSRHGDVDEALLQNKGVFKRSCNAGYLATWAAEGREGRSQRLDPAAVKTLAAQIFVCIKQGIFFTGPPPKNLI